jgi:hypothetical protein
MPLQTLVGSKAVRAGLTACRKKLAQMNHHLLTQKLEEIDHQTRELARYRERIVKLLSSLQHESETNERNETP